MIKIIHISDPHLTVPGGILYGTDPLARLDACLADVNANHADAALVVISGDLTDGGEKAAYEALRQRLENFVPPVRLMLGNHDERAGFLEVFQDVETERGFVQGVFDTAEGRLIFLDTLESGRPEGRLCETRLSWLKERLSEAGDRPILIFMHHPPFRVHMPELDASRMIDDEALGRLLEAHKNVRHIFAGHVHRLMAGSWRGIPVSAVRGTNHQTALDFSDSWKPGWEPPAYAVIFLDAGNVAVHFHEFPINVVV